MKNYTLSQALQNFEEILEQVNQDGEVLIEGNQGKIFILSLKRSKSPLDIPGVQLSQPISQEEILEFIQESRRVFPS